MTTNARVQFKVPVNDPAMPLMSDENNSPTINLVIRKFSVNQITREINFNYQGTGPNPSENATIKTHNESNDNQPRPSTALSLYDLIPA